MKTMNCVFNEVNIKIYQVIEREGNFVEPTIITGLKHDSPVVLRETFAPIVYALKASSLDEAIQINNSVEQGLSSSVFTQSLANVFQVHVLFFGFRFKNK